MSSPAAPPGGTVRHLRAVGVSLTAGIVGVEVCLAFGYFALVTVLPRIVTGFHAEHTLSLAVAASMITSIIGFVLASSWCDRQGPRPALAAGFACLVAGTSACALAPGIWVFVAGRLMGGLGTGLLGVATYSLVSHLVLPQHRSFVFGLLNAAWLLPSLIGPLVAGAAAEALGWRWVLGAVAALTVVSFGILLTGMGGRTITVDGAAVPPTPWATGIALAMALFLLHIGGERATGAWMGVAAGALVIAAVALHRILPRGTYRASAGAPRLIALRALLGATMAATESYIPYYLQQQRGMSLGLSGLVLAGAAVGWGIGAMSQARLVRLLGPVRFLRAATAVGPVAPAIILVVVATRADPWLIAGALVFLGLGLGTAFPQISTLAFDLSPQREHGSIGGALQLADSATSGAVLAGTGLVLAVGGDAAVSLVFLVPVLLGLLGARAAWHATERPVIPSQE